MLTKANTTDFPTLLSTKKGVQAVFAWFINTGILGQFSLAKEMRDESGTRTAVEGNDSGESYW